MKLAAALGTHSLTLLICRIVIVAQDIRNGFIRSAKRVTIDVYLPALLSATLSPPMIMR
jgi:hypothetical protein